VQSPLAQQRVNAANSAEGPIHVTNDASELGRSLVLYVGNCANRRPSFRLTLLPVTPANHRVKGKRKRAPFPKVSR
jgi:hypothetical protein